MKRRMMLYFGSFNPPHLGHIGMAEAVVERGLCDELVMVVSPQNPLKKSSELAPEMERFAMVELTCAASRYPERIKPSVIEFLLPKPSYTINTLRHLSAEYGSQIEFSILMGGDIIEQLHLWRDYQEILDNYKIYLYPRPNERVERYLDQITILEDMPQFNISSTEIREGLKGGDELTDSLAPEVAAYIKKSGFWRADPTILIEQAREHYRHERWGEAVNRLNRALDIEPNNIEARELLTLVQEILKFRYTDIYNP